MCGIAGIINLNGASVDLSELKRMTDIIRYRGPDDEGFLAINTHTSSSISTQNKTFNMAKNSMAAYDVAFGHRRLSILDLSQTGHQPMSTQDNALWITYNGEIYNFIEIRKELEASGYAFRSTSDTEVILHAYREWSDKCVEKFNGMFAFVILDLKKKRIFCVRDRVGIKPLYYFFNGKTFIFSSEIKQILEHSAVEHAADLKSIADYLSFQFVLENRTFIQGIKRLLPAHTISIDLQNCSLTVNCYWDIDFEPDHSRSADSFAEELEYLLRDSVRLQLRSDVPIACYLSGGIDSSAMTCLVAELLSRPVRTFTGRFEAGEEYDESKWARIVSAYAKTEYTEVTPDIDKMFGLLPAIVFHLDEPVAGPGVLPQYMVSEAAGNMVKVILGGQGGDEIFGGYGWYNSSLFRFIAGTFSFGNSVFEDKTGLGYLIDFIAHKGLRPVLSELVNIPSRRQSFQRYYSGVWAGMGAGQDVVRGLLPGLGGYNPIEQFCLDYEAMSSKNPYTAMFKFDIRNYLQALLHVEDRVSMAFSLESRVPILDHRIVELSARLPLSFKVRNDKNKYVLRKALKNILPPAILARKDKKGFPTPIEKWFDNKDSKAFSIFREERPGYDPIINRLFLDMLMKEHLTGAKKHSKILWQIMNILEWAKQNSVRSTL